MIKINFDKLINSYDTNLLDNLRGFGSDEEYLKFWVPGTTEIKSFYNLIDALFEVEQFRFIIIIKKKLYDDKLSKDVTSYLNKIGSYKKIEEKEFTNLEIKIDKNYYTKKQITNNYIIEEKFINKIDKKKKISVFKSNKKIETPYKKEIKNIYSNNYYSKINFNDKNLFIKKIEDINVNFVIENKTIIKLSHNCEKEIILKKLIEIFFDICINKNIQEAADHAVIYLEEKIRLSQEKLIKPGIILPSHAGSYFDDLNSIIREVFQEYSKKNLLKFYVNKNYTKKSYYWINLDESEKLKKINIIIRDICKKNNLTDESAIAHGIEANFKISLNCDKAFKNLQEKKNLLLEIERKIKRLDDTLEVFVEEALDKNKLRIKNSPQTKLLN